MDNSTRPAELADYNLVVRWPVQWGDQDAFQHVNNIIYIRWFETARIEYGVRVGLAALMEREQIGPILASITCQFRRPVTYPDTVQIGARVTRLGRSSFSMEHRIYSEAAGAIVAEGDSTIVVFDYRTQKSHAIPDAIRQAIETLEKKSLSSPA